MVNFKKLSQEAEQSLADIPNWIRVVMYAQVILTCLSLMIIGAYIESLRAEIGALVSLSYELIQHSAQSAEKIKMMNGAIDIGLDGSAYLVYFFITVSISITIGSVLTVFSPWKSEDPERVIEEMFKRRG